MQLTPVFPVVLALLLAAFSVRAQTLTNGAVRPISLDDCIQMALQHNLGLQISRINPSIARLNLFGSYGVYDPVFRAGAAHGYDARPGGFNDAVGITTPPNITQSGDFTAGFSGYAPTGLRYNLNAGVTHTTGQNPRFDTNLNQFVFVDRDPQYQSYARLAEITQPLLKDFWIDQNRMTIQLNKKQVKISDLTLQFQVMTIVRAVQQAYFDLISTRENVKALQLALELADRLVVENKRKVEIGTMAELDEKQAEAQAAQARADLIEASNSVVIAQNTLKRLFTDNYQEWHGVRLDTTDPLSDAPVIFNLADSWNSGLELRPDYLQLKVEIEKQNIVLKYNYNQLFPSLDLTGSYGRAGLARTAGDSFESIAANENPNWGVGGVLSFPLTRRSERANYKVAKDQVKEALLTLKQKEQNIIVDIDDATKTAQSSLERVQATRQARVFAEAALLAERKKLESGKSTTFVVLRLQRDLTTTQVGEIRALADYNKALSELSFRDGTILRRNRVSFDVK